MVMTLRRRVAAVSQSPNPPPLTRKKMVARKKKKSSNAKTLRPGRRGNGSDSDSGSGSSEGNTTTGYEKFREERIRENRERMEKLGILSLSSQMFDSKKPGRPTRIKTLAFKNKRNPPLVPRPPARRSSRLKNAGGNYFEDERSLKDMGITIPDSWKSEVYTEEDEKLLGDCETPWNLNVDGFGEDGEPLYDPVNGTSCHQCRQKTLRKHTFCSKCRSGQGQLCGDCLYTRYGENLLEAVTNPSWLCPACRGICNCSRCRRTKGWPPVTIMYSKLIESGFKSVAHNLIQTRRAGYKPQPESGNVMVDLKAGETQAPLDHECSDMSSEWRESDCGDSDSDVSKPEEEKSGMAFEERVDVTEISSAPAHKNVFLQEMTVNGGLDCYVS